MTQEVQGKPTSPPRPTLSKGKLWAFRLVALVGIPLLLFGGLEIVLRLTGYGYPTAALIEREFGGKTLCTANAQFGWRFFPRQMAREFDPGLNFIKTKPPGTLRIFVLGGSAARGTPDDAYCFGRHLEAMLSTTYPDIRFEVYNAAMTAINSHVVREIAKDCANHQPDLFIIYMGNNEVVGPYGPGTVLTDTPPSLAMIRTSNALKATRLGQLSEALLGGLSGKNKSSKQWQGMAMFLDKQVRADAPEMAAVHHHFEANLRDIYHIALDSGAKVVVSTVPVNLRDCPPFSSLHKQGLPEPELKKWQATFDQAIEREENGNYPEAIESYLAAAKIDGSFAELQFRLGRCYWECGNFEEARPHYQAAMQQDTLRFRADSRINDVIRSTAAGRAEEGIHLADSVAAFAEASPHQTPGGEFFYEHVHLNDAGNYLLARTIFPFVQSALLSKKQAQADIPTQEQVAQRIAYTKFDEFTDLQTMAELYLSKPPFTHQIYHEAKMEDLQAKMAALRNNTSPSECMQQYEQAIRDNPGDWRLYLKQYQLIYSLQGESDLTLLETTARKINNLHPYDRGFVTLGKVLNLQQRYDESDAALQRALYLNPASGQAQYTLAINCVKRGNTAGAINYLQQSIRNTPAVFITPYRLLATQYDNTGKTELGINALRQAIAVFPEDQTTLVRCQLGELLNKQGQHAAALQELETALRIDPSLSANSTFQNQLQLSKGGKD